MATGRDSSSVLAKLMGINRKSTQRETSGRRRVLSENYLRNIASVGHREKSSSELDVSVLSMDVDGDLGSGEMGESYEGVSVDDPQSSLRVDGNADFTSSGGCLNWKSSLEKATSLTLESAFEHCKGFNLRDGTCSSLGHLTGQNSSCASVAQKHTFIKALAWEPKSSYSISRGSYEGQREVLSGYDSPVCRVRNVIQQDELSCASDNSFFSSSRWSRNTGVGPRQRRTKSFHSGAESATTESVSTEEIAKQVTSQRMQRKWHSSVDVSQPAPISIKSSDPDWLSDSGETRNSKKHSFEPLQARKFSEEPRTSRARKFQDQMFTMHNTNLSGRQVGATRYLSKPTLFPSAWVPRSKARTFTLDRNWCIGPVERKSKVCNESLEDNFSLQDVVSSSEPSGPSLSLEQGCFDEGTRLISHSSLQLGDRKMSEDVYTICESFSEKSALSDVESPTYHEACILLNETGENLLNKDVSQDSLQQFLSSNSNSSPAGEASTEVILEANKKVNTSFEMQLEELSAKSSTKVSLENDSPICQDIHSKHELKASPPGSPVSSLEGPEACRRSLHFTVESNNKISTPEGFGNDVLGLETQLQLIEAVSLGSGFEPGMVVSSDDGDEVGSVNCYREDTQIAECTSENRDFSYLVDVLIESGVLTKNLEMKNETWGASGYVLNPSLFALLEKKYGKSTTRERSERRLLFDRINSGLLEIFQPPMGIITRRKPVAKRFVARHCKDLIEEELWALLVNQEQEIEKDQSDNVCRGEMEWLDLGEDVNFIAQELQSLVVDELIEEFVSKEMSFCLR